MSFSTNPIGFIFGLLLVGLTVWYIRARLESNPEPFFLSFTFFAFAGQFVRSAEWSAKPVFGGVIPPGLGRLWILVGIGAVTAALQVVVMGVHFAMTRAHYRKSIEESFETHQP